MKFFQTAFIFSCLLLSLNVTYAQVQIENLSFEKALKKANKEDKILMVVVDAKNCDLCNDFAKQGFSNEKTFAINKLAVTIELSPNNLEWEKLNNKYYSASATKFGVLFFNNAGTLIHRFDKSTNNGTIYLTELGTALQNLNAPAEMAKLEVAVKKEAFKNIETINLLRLKRKSLSLPTEDLMESFINSVPRDSFDALSYFQLLARFAPVLNTEADSVLRFSNSFRGNWNMFDNKEKTDINNDIYHKTWLKAVATKDYLLASRLADFSTSQNYTNRETQSNKRAYRLAIFYKAINDTTEYLRFGASFIEGNLMRWVPDSLKKFYMERVETSMTNQLKDGSTPVITYVSSLQNASNELNTFAWNFYKMSSDTAVWRKALSWAKRAMEYYVTPELLDTYAQLLYVTGNHEEAILQEQKVIEEKKKAHREKDIPITERILARMQSGAIKVAE